jgi:peptidoglycan-N-acetylglucosamine deacetylase
MAQKTMSRLKTTPKKNSEVVQVQNRNHPHILLLVMIVLFAFGGFILTKHFITAHRNAATVASDFHDEDAVITKKTTNVQSKPKDTPVTHTYGDVVITPEIQPEAKPGELIPVYYSIKTKQPVVFLGMDDGYVKNDEAVKYMKDHNIKVSLFIVDKMIAGRYDYFQQIIDNGSIIEDHSMTHRNMPSLSYEDQKKDICDAADNAEKQFHHRPILFRPPGGSYNDVTRKAAGDCGMKAIIHWHAKVDGGYLQYQDGHHLQAGDIVLMHFRPRIMDDLAAFNKEVTDRGLHVELLEDWIK